MNPETPEAFQSNPPPEELVNQAEYRQRLFGQLDAEFVAGAATTRTPEELDILMEEILAAGGALRPDGDEGLPDLNFPGARIEGAEPPPTIPGSPAPPDWGPIITRIRAAKENRIMLDPTLATRFDATIPLEAAQRPIQYLQQRARDLVDAGYMKTETGRGSEPDGLFSGNRLQPTTVGLDPAANAFRAGAETAIRDHADALINERLTPDPAAGILTGAAAGRALGESIREAMSRGFLDLGERPKAAGAPKGPAEFDITAVDDRRVSGISDIFQQQYQAAREAFALAVPPDVDAEAALATYMRELASRRELPRLRTAGANARNELLSGANADQAREARRRIAQLNEIEERNRAQASYKPNIAFANTRAERRQRAAARAAGFADRTRAAGATDAAWDAAFAEDSAARENIRVQNEFRPRIEALQAQIDATVDRNMRTGLETAMQQLVAEQDTAAAAAGAAQVEQANRDAEWMARDPAGFAREVRERARREPRRVAFEAWANRPDTFNAYTRTREWRDVAGGPWARMSQVARDAATPYLDQAHQEFMSATSNPDRVNDLRREAFEAAERVRAEQAAKVDRIHRTNDAAELRVIAEARSNRTSESPINLGRSDISAELNLEIVNDTLRRFGMPNRPAAVRQVRLQGQREPVRDLIYQSPSSPRVAFVARYDREGILLSADLIAVQNGAFEVARRGRALDRPSAGLLSVLQRSDDRGAEGTNIQSFDTPEPTTGEPGSGGGGEGDSGDWSDYTAPRAPRARQARARNLANAGMTPETAGIITGRRTNRRPGGRGGIFGLFGF